MTAALALHEQDRATKSREIAVSHTFDLAEMEEATFARGLEKLKTGQARVQRLLGEALVKDAHFGNPNNALPKPILYAAGAEELCRIGGLRVARSETPDSEICTPEFVAVTVVRCLVDRFGNIVDETSRSCNSHEKRFRQKKGEGWTYSDPREVLNDCRAMAEKRAKVALVRSALGVTAFLAHEDEMDEAVTQRQPRALVPWTREEKAAFYAAAKGKLTREDLEPFIASVLDGRTEVGSGDDVELLIERVNALPKLGKKAKAEAEAAPEPTPAAETAAEATSGAADLSALDDDQ
jgi:hypothetical protein